MYGISKTLLHNQEWSPIIKHNIFCLHWIRVIDCFQQRYHQSRRRGGEGGGRGSKGLNETPLEVNNGGLKTQTVDFQILANSGGMENKL